MKSSIVYYLERVPFLKEIGDKELDELSKLLHGKPYGKGKILFDEGDQGDKLFIIKEGKVKIYRQSYSNNDRGPVILAILKDGDYFGEMAILQPDQYRSAYAETLEQSYIYTLQKRDFNQFLERYPKVALTLLNVALNRLRRANRVIEDALRLDSRSRIIKNIIYLAEEHGVKRGEETVINLKLTQEKIAFMVGVVRGEVNKVFKEMKSEKRDLIYMEEKKIVIKNMDKLLEWETNDFQ